MNKAVSGEALAQISAVSITEVPNRFWFWVFIWYFHRATVQAS